MSTSNQGPISRVCWNLYKPARIGHRCLEREHHDGEHRCRCGRKWVDDWPGGAHEV